MITRQWPGTSEGCDCSKSYNFMYSDLSTGTCSRNQTRDYCTDVRGTSALPVSKFYSFNICGKREGEPYSRSVKPTNNFGVTSCPSGYRVCGTGDLKKQTCVSGNNSCPINDIVISQNGTVKAGYSQAKLDGGYTVSFSKNSTGRPIVRLMLTEEEPCADPTQYASSKGRNLYRLLRTDSYSSCSNEIADSKTDPRYTKLATIREDRLFEDNGVLYVVMHLPKYPLADEKLYSWNLYANTYYHWSAECQAYAGLTTTDIIKQADKSVSVTSTQNTVMILAIIFLILASIFSCFSCCYGSGDASAIKYGKLVEVIIAITEFVLALLIVWFLFSSITTINGFNTTVLEISAGKCSDDYSNRIFTSYGEALVRIQI
jgi:hypothetical protein